MHLLLVEDELEIQSFLKRSLAEAGYQVEAAGDGKTAERLATEADTTPLSLILGCPTRTVSA